MSVSVKNTHPPAPASRAIVARGKPKDVLLPVWRKLPNVFLSFVGALVCPPPEVDLPDLIGQFPWTSLIPHGCPMPTFPSELHVWCGQMEWRARGKGEGELGDTFEVMVPQRWPINSQDQECSSRTPEVQT